MTGYKFPNRNYDWLNESTVNYNLTKYLETVCVATLPFFLAMGLFNLTYDIKFVPLGSYVKSESLRGCQF